MVLWELSTLVCRILVPKCHNLRAFCEDVSADSLKVDPGRDVSRLAADMPAGATFIVLATI